jgi:uncharacterized protein YndB with AHSA1/START domain
MLDDFDKSRFAVRIPVNAPVEKIFNAWTTPGGLEHFFLRHAAFHSPEGIKRETNDPVEVGDTYHWLWWGYPDEDSERGEVLEQNGKDLLRFSFGKAGVCTLSIYQEEGETLVELIQENIPMDDNGFRFYHMGCKQGWSFYLTNLKSVLEGGLDLRNRNIKLTRVISS